MKSYNLFFVLLFALVTSTAFASPDRSGGCGLGWEVTKQKTFSGTTTRGSTNSTASNTIAMTMGTSGCEQHSIVKNEKKIDYFTEANLDNLLAEIAQGKGEYLTAFAQTLGCQDLGAFTKTMQTEYENIASKEDISSQELLKNIRNVSNLQCTLI